MDLTWMADIVLEDYLHDLEEELQNLKALRPDELDEDIIKIHVNSVTEDIAEVEEEIKRRGLRS